MKTIYLILIALMFIVVTPEVYGGCEGGGGGDIDMTNLPPTEQYQISDDISKNSHNIKSRPLRGSADPDRVDKHFNKAIAIAFMNKNATKKPGGNNTNKNVDALVAYIKLNRLLGTKNDEELGALYYILILLIIQGK